MEKIVEGKISKPYENICLLEQPFIKDNSKTIGDLINEAIVLLGENIVVGRFARLRGGGTIVTVTSESDTPAEKIVKKPRYKRVVLKLSGEAFAGKLRFRYRSK